MELKTLYYFLTVAREENITKAAQRLYIGQPALSRQLMQLEDEVGVQLLIRGKRKIQLTQEGMLLRRRAEEILSLVDKTEKELIGDENELSGELMIGVAECMASHTFLPEVIHSFIQKNPQVTYDLYTGDADLIKERLDKGIIDIGILLEPVDVEKYDFIRLPQKERWGLLVNINHPLASQDHITKKDLLNIPLLVPKRSIVQNEIAGWFQEEYDQLHFIATQNLISNSISLVLKEIGSIITIEGALCNHDRHNIKFLPFEPELSTGTVLVWKKNQICSSLVNQFLKEIYHSLNA